MRLSRAAVHTVVVLYFMAIPTLIVMDVALALLLPLYVLGVPVFALYYRFVNQA